MLCPAISVAKDKLHPKNQFLPANERFDCSSSIGALIRLHFSFYKILVDNFVDLNEKLLGDQ